MYIAVTVIKKSVLSNVLEGFYYILICLELYIQMGSYIFKLFPFVMVFPERIVIYLFNFNRHVFKIHSFQTFLLSVC
jgi:hypothetical protein